MVTNTEDKMLLQRLKNAYEQDLLDLEVTAKYDPSTNSGSYTLEVILLAKVRPFVFLGGVVVVHVIFPFYFCLSFFRRRWQKHKKRDGESSAVLLLGVYPPPPRHFGLLVRICAPLPFFTSCTICPADFPLSPVFFSELSDHRTYHTIRTPVTFWATMVDCSLCELR